MADKRVTYPYFKYWTSAGAFAASYTVTTYQAGTSNLCSVYTDSALSVAHDNPLTLDSSGEAEIYLAEATKFVIKDTDGVTVKTIDNIDPTTWDADEISYDNTTSGYTSDNVQDVIDEIVAEIEGLQTINPNRVLNSEMMIDQRNAGAAVSSSYAFICDRFYGVALNTDNLVFSASQTTGIGGCRNSIKFTATTKEDAWASNDVVIPFEYKFLGYDVADLAGKTVTVSFYFQASEAGTYSFALCSGDFTRSYVTDFSYSTVDTAQLITKTITLESGSTTITNSTTDVGMALRFAGYSGTVNSTSSTDEWVDGSKVCSTSALDWAGTTNNYVQMSGLQLVVGNYTGTLGSKSREDYLLECLPYYRKSFDQGVAPAQNSGDDNGALTYWAQEANTTDGVQVDFTPPMVGVPSITFYNVDAANAKWRNATDAGDSGTAAADSTGVAGFFARNPSVATDGTGEKLYVHYSANAEI